MRPLLASEAILQRRVPAATVISYVVVILDTFTVKSPWNRLRMRSQSFWHGKPEGVSRNDVPAHLCHPGWRIALR